MRRYNELMLLAQRAAGGNLWVDELEPRNRVIRRLLSKGLIKRDSCRGYGLTELGQSVMSYVCRRQCLGMTPTIQDTMFLMLSGPVSLEIGSPEASFLQGWSQVIYQNDREILVQHNEWSKTRLNDMYRDYQDDVSAIAGAARTEDRAASVV